MRRVAHCLPLLGVLLLPMPARAETTLTDKQIERLETLSELGREACQSGNYESCHRMFTEAQELLPWAPHQFYIAEALVGLGRMIEGIDLWRQVLEDNTGSKDPVTREFVKQTKLRLAEEERNLPVLLVTLAREHAGVVEVIVDGKPIAQDVLTAGMPLDPGKHVIEFSQPGYAQERHTLVLNRGGSESLTVALTPLPAEQEPSAAADGRSSPPVTPHDGGWNVPAGVTLMAVGGAAVLGGGVAFLLKEQRVTDLEADCGDVDPCQALTREEFDDRNARIEDRTLVVNVLFFGGAALAVGGAALVLLDVLDEPESSESGAGAVSAAVARDGAWMGWQMAF